MNKSLSSFRRRIIHTEIVFDGCGTRSINANIFFLLAKFKIAYWKICRWKLCASLQFAGDRVALHRSLHEFDGEYNILFMWYNGTEKKMSTEYGKDGRKFIQVKRTMRLKKQQLLIRLTLYEKTSGCVLSTFIIIIKKRKIFFLHSRLQRCQHFILYAWWIEINEKRISNVAQLRLIQWFLHRCSGGDDDDDRWWLSLMLPLLPNFPLLWREMKSSFFLYFHSCASILTVDFFVCHLRIFFSLPICRSFLNLFSLNFFTIIYYCMVKLKAPNTNNRHKKSSKEWI